MYVFLSGAAAARERGRVGGDWRSWGGGREGEKGESASALANSAPQTWGRGRLGKVVRGWEG